MTHTANILVVDDTVENLKLLANMLGRQGFEVRPVTNGKQALSAAGRDPPDLVLLDINMPEMDGFEVCAQFKANPALRDIPIVFLTALNELADKVKAFEVGGVDYITKPFQVEEVQARVRTHVSLRRASRELSESYARLHQLERLRDDLVHMVVHDMRSPLMVLMGHLDLLQESAAALLTEENREDLSAALRAARTVNGMANDLLDVSRLEEGKLPVSPAPHDLCEIAAEARGVLRGFDHGRRIQFEAPGSLEVPCDRELVRRVIENLVSNAVKHTPPGGTLSITVGVQEGRAQVTVSDEGPGVPEAARPHLFEKFGTLTKLRDPRYHSAGLGLSFCKLAIEAHGGTIGMNPHEKGSTFWFALPL